MHKQYFIRVGYTYVKLLLDFCKTHSIAEYVVSTGWLGNHVDTYLFCIDSMDEETLIALKLSVPISICEKPT